MNPKIFLRYLYHLRRSHGMKPFNSIATDDKLISYFDWWPTESAESLWFTGFVRKHFANNKKKLHFYGPFGNNKFVKRDKSPNKIFFSGENPEFINNCRKLNGYSGPPIYSDLCVEDVQLSMGFEEIKKGNYLRFPLWILYFFPPESSESDIVQKVKEFNSVSYNKTKACAVISRHDYFGTRTMICDSVSHILDIDYAGKWRNNNDKLQKDFNDNKKLFLRDYKFNICPENTNTPFYVTEKLFEAMLCDCVPLYYGSDNNPEPKVINKDAVIFFSPGSDNSASMRMIKELNESDTKLKEFLAQPKLLETAADYVISRFAELKKHLSKMID